VFPLHPVGIGQGDAQHLQKSDDAEIDDPGLHVKRLSRY
jgi:hypothetical protein